ncbi:TLC domain-containing protein 2 [Collichthys lucidus]|uniref:TLC domain-containing protein 2 n=1 Tax=Collichthys lucidus TaxID=240159 RepID=A0A4U5V838_COLLU|nr:TLC domain-containing protein 2 [Collichthys lucidus]
MDLKSTLLVIGGSACSFKLLNTIVRILPTLEPAHKKAWKWRNIITSLAHSLLTGAWAVLCLYHQPHMVEDLISSHSLFSHRLVAVSTGYFINDFLDLALNQSIRQSWEVLLHHYMVITATPSIDSIAMFLVFRVCATGWMIHWLATHSELVPRYVLMMGTVGLSLISTMNMVLCYRLLRTDILTSTGNTGKNH